MKLQVKAENTNYVAKVIRLNELRPHPNANKLQIASVLGYNVITGLDAKKGDWYVYFPLECAINKNYLSWSNSFSDAELNKDTKKKGFFPSSGRVKAVKLRSVASEGYIVPLSDLFNWFETNCVKIDIDAFTEGVDFDTVDNILVCAKYINEAALRKMEQEANREKNKGKKAVRVSKIIENQYRVAEDTSALKRNVQNINPADLISISYKMHGCNGSMGKVLCRRPLNWYEKLLKKIGVKIDDKHYDLVYASRRILKNAYADKVSQSFYDMDVWKLMADKYKDTLKNGITLYGEIVNQLPNGKWIQGNFDYGIPEKQCEFFVYRITYTNPSGDIFEFSRPQIDRYCSKAGLKVVPLFYYGLAKDWDATVSIDEHWHKNFLEKLILKYNEKDCYMCINKVPCEGIVLVKESDFFEAYKLKSMSFLARESEELDSGKVDIETAENVAIE